MNERNEIENTMNHAPACKESDALVAYLYGEASATEAKVFERHITACGACRSDLAAFGDVRRAVGEWRDESLHLSQPLVFQTAHAVRQTERAPGLRAALHALREFFDLSPLWLKTGGAFAMLAVCALAVFALTNTEVRWNDHGFAFNTNPTRERIETQTAPTQNSIPAQNSISQDEIEQMVNARVADRLRNIEEREAAIARAEANQTSPNRNTASPSVVTPREQSARRRAPAPTVSPEQPQLVRREATRDSEPPRLYDLLGEVQ